MQEAYDKALTVNGHPLQSLYDGVSLIVSGLKSAQDSKSSRAMGELESVISFLETIQLIQDTLPEDRLREIISQSIKSARKAVGQIPPQVLKKADIPIHPVLNMPECLHKVLCLLGPVIRIDQNGMSAWIHIKPEESTFFTPTSIFQNLATKGIIKGVNPKAVQDIFINQSFGMDVCVAKGKPPKQGKDGKIEYVIHVEDLGKAPRLLESGQVSYKDIELFKYVAIGEVIAVKIPPTPGQPGYTVYGQPLQPIEVVEAEFVKLPHTHASVDGTKLVASEECCVTKRNGALILEPSLRVAGNVSFETGNIRSKVSVLIKQDVLTDFSVESEKDISVDGIVEGALIRTNGSLFVRGGIIGKDKALIEVEEDFTAKFIKNATVHCHGNVTVESEVMQSQVNVDGKLVVKGSPGHIVGGEINAEMDVIAEVIGSELGVVTFIKVGMNSEKLLTLLEENKEKMRNQYCAVEKCQSVIERLNQYIAGLQEVPQNIRNSLDKAIEMKQNAEKNLHELEQELEQIQRQYEESMKTPKSVRAKSNILPGTTVNIQGIEASFEAPTGPCMIVKQGDSLEILPYSDISL